MLTWFISTCHLKYNLIQINNRFLYLRSFTREPKLMEAISLAFEWFFIVRSLIISMLTFWWVFWWVMGEGEGDQNHLDDVTDHPAILFTSYSTKNSIMILKRSPPPPHPFQRLGWSGNPDYDVIWQLICCSVLCTAANPLQPFLTSHLIPSGCIKAVSPGTHTQTRTTVG